MTFFIFHSMDIARHLSYLLENSNYLRILKKKETKSFVFFLGLYEIYIIDDCLLIDLLNDFNCLKYADNKKVNRYHVDTANRYGHIKLIPMIYKCQTFYDLEILLPIVHI